MYTYRFDVGYEENYRMGPVPMSVPTRPSGGEPGTLFGLHLRSHLGLFSGPLLNSRWVSLYARLGYDVLVYKTVRSKASPSHPWPNCAYIEGDRPLALKAHDRPPFLEARVTWPTDEEAVTMTNSYGMPSQLPEVWQQDVQAARDSLGDGQILMVSVVGDDLEDYARTAAMAVAAGAQAVELNLSCPNVLGREGTLFLDPQATAAVCQAVRQSIERAPLVVKLGYVEDPPLLERLLDAVAPFVQGVSGINTIPMEIRDESGGPLLGPGRALGRVCGAMIRACGLDFTRRLAAWKRRRGVFVELLCGGGITAPEHVEDYRSAGADVAMLATAAMVNPLLAYQYHQSETATSNR